MLTQFLDDCIHFLFWKEFLDQAEAPQCIDTTLGSCVAITLWHPQRLIGGMCHFVLPTRARPEAVNRATATMDGRYADEVMGLFEREAHRHATVLNQYQVKIFGGGDMVADAAVEEAGLVGYRNIRAALSLLARKRVTVTFRHVGETGSRRISFDLASGEVQVRHTPLT